MRRAMRAESYNRAVSDVAPERGGVSPPVLGRKGLCIYYFREFMGVME